MSQQSLSEGFTVNLKEGMMNVSDTENQKSPIPIQPETCIVSKPSLLDKNPLLRLITPEKQKFYEQQLIEKSP